MAVVGISASNANAAVDSVTGAAGGGYLQQYVGVPGAAGTDNQAGSTLRVAVTFPAASGGTATQTGTANIASWAGGSQTLTHGGFWSASTGGTFRGSITYTTPRSVTNGASIDIAGLIVTASPVAAN